MSLNQIWFPILLTVIAGISTGIGGLIAISIKDLKKSYLKFSLGLSAGVMIYVSFVELLSSAIKNIGFFKSNLAFFSGMAVIMIIDFLIPHDYIEEHIKTSPQNKKIMTAGVLTAIGIAIHNFPEGIAVLVSTLGNVNLGISVAFAITIHNIPEGIAVAMPVFYATKSRKKAFWYSLLSGIAEPIGAIIGIVILMPFISPLILSLSFAFVAGIMIFISFDELLPLCYGECGESHLSIIGIILGMLIMAVSLHLIK